MKAKITKVIFTDRKQDWSPYHRNGKGFFMLHIQLEDWKWISKFYNKKELDPSSKLKEWDEYEIEIKVIWEFTNLISIQDKDWNIII
jgi:hypothetical protein